MRDLSSTCYDDGGESIVPPQMVSKEPSGDPGQRFLEKKDWQWTWIAVIANLAMYFPRRREEDPVGLVISPSFP